VCCGEVENVFKLSSLNSARFFFEGALIGDDEPEFRPTL